MAPDSSNTAGGNRRVGGGPLKYSIAMLEWTIADRGGWMLGKV